MSPSTPRPQTLWSWESFTPSVDKYIDAYGGEFDIGLIDTDYPYHGRPSNAFRRLTKVDDHEAGERFEGRGIGCWTLRRDRTLNGLTADLLAAADALSENSEATSESASPGGIGADSSTIWLPLLDGGVGVKVVVWQHQYTNRLKARQLTTIRGPRAYRALLELLGFDWINRKLPGEQVMPSHEEFIKIVNDLLTKAVL